MHATTLGGSKVSSTRRGTAALSRAIYLDHIQCTWDLHTQHSLERREDNVLAILHARQIDHEVTELTVIQGVAISKAGQVPVKIAA